MVDSPIAESIEYRPPTHAQKQNMFAVSIPNDATFSAFVLIATKCFDTAASSPRRLVSQSRAVVALVIVSRVVKVLDETMNRVWAGSRSLVASTKSVESTFDTKRNARCGSA